jgi:hypothetical protein
MAFAGTQIEFPKEEDVLFMGQNVFGHDFIHDFNTVNMLDRLRKIGGDITRLQTAMMFGGDPDPTETIEASQADNYLECGEAETYSNLMAISGGLPQETQAFFTGTRTRSKVKAIQNLKTVIYESKLFVMGLFNSVPTEGEIEEERFFGGAVASARDNRVMAISKVGPRSSGKFSRSVSAKNLAKATPGRVEASMQKYDKSLYKCVELGFDAAISDSIKSAPMMKHYFEFMKKIYLCFKNIEVHPFTTFNNSFIEDAMVIYCLKPSYFEIKINDNEKNIYNEENIYNILSLLQNGGSIERSMGKEPYNGMEEEPYSGIEEEPYSGMEEEPYNVMEEEPYNRIKEDDGDTFMRMNGGTLITDQALAEFRDQIKIEFAELFQYATAGTELPENKLPNRDRTSGADGEMFSKATRFKDEFRLFEETTVSPDDKLHKLIKQMKRQILPKYAVLESNKNKCISARGRNQPLELKRYSHALSDFIVSFLYETINTYLDDKAERLSRPVSEGSLTPVQISNVQKIAATVAYCVKTYIGNGNGENALLNAQQQILEHISNNKNIGSADNNLLNAFRAYVNRMGPRTKVINQEEIAAKIRLPGVKSVLRVIDNAAPLEAFASMRIQPTQIYCPNSSIVDPMGSFGSCSGPTPRRENYGMNFMISSTNGVNSYIGETRLTANNILKIMYYANFNEFILPHVEMEIDMTSTRNITVLSANNTFKSVINKVLLIWKTRITGPLPNPDLFWEMLKNKAIFSELVSVGSLKSVGDFYQEINTSAKKGAYTGIGGDAVGRSYRLGAMGDRPSGVRAGYILFSAISGKHPKAIAGYFDKTGDNTFAIINEEITGGRKMTKKRTKHNKKQSRKLKA